MSQVVVTEVKPSSVGELIGLHPKDVILEVYGIPVKSRAQLIETMAAESKTNDSLFVTIERMGEKITFDHPDPADSFNCYVKDKLAEKTEGQTTPGGGRLYILGVIGILSLAVGLYFLFFSSGEMVNLHRLGIGQTLAIIGALFIAAEWRPKSSTHTTK